MRFRSPVELGALIRQKRRKLGLEQKALAEQVGVSRQWIIDVEKGKPRAALGLVLRTANALGILLDASDEPPRQRDIAERLRILRADPSASRLRQDHGHFSLAGAQPKTALLLENGRWGVPSGRARVSGSKLSPLAF